MTTNYLTNYFLFLCSACFLFDNNPVALKCINEHLQNKPQKASCVLLRVVQGDLLF